MEHIEIELLPIDRWRWIYTDGNGARALSNDLYEDIVEAERAAKKAYPDLPIVRHASHPGDDEPDLGQKRALIKLGLLGLLAVLVIGLGWRLASSKPPRD